MKKIRRLVFSAGLIACVIWSLFYSNALAGGVGTTGAQFLKISPSARATGMGEAYSALGDDPYALFFNPAGIANIGTRAVSATYLRYFQSINYGSLAGVYPLGRNVFGMGINYLGVPDIDKRTGDTDDPSGTSSPDGTFSATDMALSLTYARKDVLPSLLENLDIGGNLRLISQSIDTESAFSAMVDIGALYRVNDSLSVALNLQNIGMKVKFKNDSDALPFNLKAGCAYRPLKGLTIALDLNEFITDELLYASIGAEYWFMNIVALRAGYKYGYDTDSLGSNVGICGGIGFAVYNFGLDYGFAPFGELGDTHRVSLSVKF